MSDKPDSVYLKHILDAITKIEQYSKGLSFDDFILNSLFQDGVIRQIEILGEATKRLSIQLVQKYPEVPWKKISGMRDKLIHDYMGVDIRAVWLTIQNDIPLLKQAISSILSVLEGS